jgi:hypothetical protein
MNEWYDREIHIDVLCEYILGITSRQYYKLAAAGKVAPVVDGHVTCSAACHTYIAYLSDLPSKSGSAALVEERTRLTRLSADSKELSLEKERGVIIETDAAMRLWAGIIMTIKKHLLAFPRKISPVVFGASRVAEIQEIMEAEVVNILNELAELDLESISR